MKNRVFISMAVMLFLTLSLQGQEESFDFDPGAVIDFSLKEMNGYVLQYNFKYGLVFFCPSDNPTMSRALGVYDCRRQYWTKVSEGFDTRLIDLKKFFLKIDLSKTTLNRLEPGKKGVLDFVSREASPADLSRDKKLKDFVGYLDRNHATQGYVDLILGGGNNPAKRGAGLPDRGINYLEGEVGIQYENMKPARYKNKLLKREEKKEIVSAGGMEYYFMLHEKEYLRLADYAYNVFRDNSPVPLTIVEVVPRDGKEAPMLRGEALRLQVNQEMEKAYHKPFKVTLKQAQLDYALLTRVQGTPLSYMDRLLKEYVQPQVGDGELYLYYFTDSRRLRAFDSDGSHPVEKGAYATDWERFKKTFIHEFGHALGLRHHFSQQLSRDKRAYISLPCVMNYSFRNDEICYLCAYGLGVEEYGKSGVESSDVPVDRYAEAYRYERRGNTIVSYSPGSGEPGGEYNFKAGRLISFKPAEDGVIVLYSPGAGKTSLGRFSKELKFIAEYNLGGLLVRDYIPDGDRVVVFYSRDERMNYIGAFDREMKFIGETLFENLEIKSFRARGEILVLYRSSGGDEYLGILSKELVFQGEHNFGKERIINYTFSGEEIALTLQGSARVLRFNRKMEPLEGSER